MGGQKLHLPVGGCSGAPLFACVLHIALQIPHTGSTTHHGAPCLVQHTITVTHNTPPDRLPAVACTRPCPFPWLRLPTLSVRFPVPCPTPPPSVSRPSPVIKPYKSAPRNTLRMGLPSKGRMAEDTMELLRVRVYYGGVRGGAVP